MPRRIKSRAPADDEKAAAVARMEAFVGKPNVRKAAERENKRRRTPGARRHETIEKVRERMRARDWTGEITATQLVALYWLCHEHVYGTPPIELDKVGLWNRVCMLAATMVKTHFDGDYDRAIVFMRWVWAKEQGKEKWARENKKETRRISWQNQFVHGHLITSWRTAGIRSQNRR